MPRFISFHHTMYRKAKPVERCQCCQQGVAFAYTHSSSYFFRDNDSSKVVDPKNNPCCFHIYKNLLDLQICNVSICKHRRFILDLWFYI